MTAVVSRVLLVAAVAGAVGSLVTALVYLNFSARVMPALGRMPATHGIAAMQAFNRTAVQPPFMAAFFGAAVAGVVLVVRLAALDANEPASASFWTTYLVSWTRANTVRAALSVVAFLALVASTVLALRSARP